MRLGQRPDYRQRSCASSPSHKHACLAGAAPGLQGRQQLPATHPRAVLAGIDQAVQRRGGPGQRGEAPLVALPVLDLDEQRGAWREGARRGESAAAVECCAGIAAAGRGPQGLQSRPGRRTLPAHTRRHTMRCCPGGRARTRRDGAQLGGQAHDGGGVDGGRLAPVVPRVRVHRQLHQAAQAVAHLRGSSEQGGEGAGVGAGGRHAHSAQLLLRHPQPGQASAPAGAAEHPHAR